MVKSSVLLQIQMDLLEVIEVIDEEIDQEVVKCPIKVQYKRHRNGKKVWRRKKGKQKNLESFGFENVNKKM